MEAVTFKIPTDIKGFLTIPTIRSFLKSIPLPIPSHSDKGALLQLITDAIASGKISISSFEEFLSKQLKRGYNRTLYFSVLKPESAKKLQSIDFVRECLKEDNWPIDNFTNFIESTRPVECVMAHLKIEHDDDEVSKIELCFTETVQLRSGTRTDTDFTWIEIDTTANKLLIRLRDRGQTTADMNNQRTTYRSFLSLVRKLFGLDFEYTSNYRNTLYKIFQDLTAKAEAPFVEKVKTLNASTEDYIQSCFTQLPVASRLVKDEFRARLNGLLMRTMIQEDFEKYSMYTIGKRGFIKHYYYTDGTGASVNARADSDENSISRYDIFLDTKQSIDKLKVMDKLWVTWFKDNGDSKITRINTKLEVFNECYVVHFLRCALVEEAETHVLSEFKYFEELQD